MNKFSFEPSKGLLDETAFPSNPTTGQAARGQIQTPLNQIKDFINTNLVDTFNENLLADSGYQKLPSGLLLQWGKTTVTFSNEKQKAVYINFTKNFLTKCFVVIPTEASNTIGAYGYFNTSGSPVDTTRFVLGCVRTDSTLVTGTLTVSWIAIGY